MELFYQKTDGCARILRVAPQKTAAGGGPAAVGGKRSGSAGKPDELGGFAVHEEGKEVSYDKLYINMENYELRVNGEQIDTPPKEMELIYHLASNPNRVYTRDQLLDEVWGFEYYGDSRTVDVHVKRLREKLDGISEEWTLKTVWGVGYKFEVKQHV